MFYEKKSFLGSYKMVIFPMGSGSQVQEMSTAALGYHRVLNENRKLYNMVQDLKGNKSYRHCNQFFSCA